MVIQTLAENAVKHGITALRGLGMITVSVRLAHNGRVTRRVLVKVVDNGPGFPENFRLGQLPKPSRAGGFGLNNIQQRLMAYYGDDTTLWFGRDESNSATVVSFEIPAVAYITGNE
jgi:sensor histidine kinase YesM